MEEAVVSENEGVGNRWEGRCRVGPCRRIENVKEGRNDANA
jgi:hypothetical protein